MNALYVIYRYITLKAMSKEERAKQVPRAIFFAGKAAPGYITAKRIIKLITSIGNYLYYILGGTVNNDKDIGDLLKVVFLPNYNVSSA